MVIKKDMFGANNDALNVCNRVEQSNDVGGIPSNAPRTLADNTALAGDMNKISSMSLGNLSMFKVIVEKRLR